MCLRPGHTPHMVRGGSTKRKFEKRAISRFLSDPKPHAKNDQKSPFSRVKSSTTYRLNIGSFRAPTPPIWTPNHPPKGVLVWGAGPPICQSYSQFKIGTRMSWKDHFSRSRQKKKTPRHKAILESFFETQNALLFRYGSNLPWTYSCEELPRETSPSVARLSVHVCES